MIMCVSFDGARISGTRTMNQESADGAETCKLLGFLLTTGLTSELDLRRDGNKWVLVAIVGISSPAGSTYDVQVKITEETTVK
jgi:hypothetical protein